MGWALCGAVTIGCLLAPLQAQSGQQIPELFNIFAGLANSAIVDAARREWQSRPLREYNCLASRGVSADQLAARGMGPSDLRVRQMLGDCAPAVEVAPYGIQAQATEGNTARPANRNFVVGGITLGAIIHPEADRSATYNCHPSEEFVDYSWCSTHHDEAGKFGRHTVWLSILHSDAYSAVYISSGSDSCR
jgi:hypothetical protein